MQERVSTIKKSIGNLQREQLGKITYIVSTAILILIFSFFIKGTVNGKSGVEDFSNKIQLADIAEREYMEDLKEMLVTMGIAKSGITMTKRIGIDGDFTYTVQIHNKQLNTMNSLEQTSFFTELETLSISMQGTKFVYLIQ